MRHLLPALTLLALTACANERQVPADGASIPRIMIEENAASDERRFSRPVAEVDTEDFRFWHGHDLADPQGLPTPDGLAASIGTLPDVLEVPAGDWDRAVVYTGFGQDGGKRFVMAHTLQLSREFGAEAEARSFHREISTEAADRFGDTEYLPQAGEHAFASWRIDDPTIDWGWPRAEARIHRNGMRVTATYRFFLQDRATSMRRVGKMRPLGSPGGSTR